VNLLHKPKQKEIKLGQKFMRKFPSAIIAKDKNTGLLVLLFKSVSGAVLQVGTDQKEPQELNSKKKEE